jgi:hypothetical protein
MSGSACSRSRSALLPSLRHERCAIPHCAEALDAVTLWLVAVALLCSTTVGRLWAIPGVLLLAAAGITLAACGWTRFRTIVAANWLRGLLGLLGAFELLMAVTAGPPTTVAASLVAGGALVVAAIVSRPSRRTTVTVLVAATLPFVALTWWTIVTPLLSVSALAVGLAATRHGAHSTPAVALLEPQPVG